MGQSIVNDAQEPTTWLSFSLWVYEYIGLFRLSKAQKQLRQLDKLLSPTGSRTMPPSDSQIYRSASDELNLWHSHLQSLSFYALAMCNSCANWH